MAIIVYPLNNIDFTAEDVAIYNSTRTSGIYAGDDFAISLTGSDNTISIDVGLAWMHLSRFNGVAVALKSKTSVDMGLPNATFPRIDALVLQFDANKNGAELVSKQGTASSNPQPPAVSRTEALYELHLLHVRRNAGAASITAADVTDLRLNSQYCGLMADSVSRVDTEAINAQVTALIQKLQEDLKEIQDQTYYASKEFVQEEVGKAAPFNYAHNSDFEHFIAQMGIGGNDGNQAYAGDRWILDSGTVSGTKNSGRVGYSSIKLNGTIRQIVENPPEVGTAAVNMISGTADISYQNGELIITSDGGVLKNVRLFAGTLALVPDYRPKGYTVELESCQRHYVRFDGQVVLMGGRPNSGKLSLNLYLPVTMRITPSVAKLPNAVRVRGGGKSIAESSLKLRSCSAQAKTQNYVRIETTWDNTFGESDIYEVTLEDLQLSANR